MPNETLNLAIAALTSAIVVDMYNTRRNKKFAKAATDYISQLQAGCEIRDAQVDYLIHMIQTNETPIDEFDAIALQQLNLIKK